MCRSNFCFFVRESKSKKRTKKKIILYSKLMEKTIKVIKF